MTTLDGIVNDLIEDLRNFAFTEKTLKEEDFCLYESALDNLRTKAAQLDALAAGDKVLVDPGEVERLRDAERVAQAYVTWAHHDDYGLGGDADLESAVKRWQAHEARLATTKENFAVQTPSQQGDPWKGYQVGVAEYEVSEEHKAKASGVVQWVEPEHPTEQEMGQAEADYCDEPADPNQQGEQLLGQGVTDPNALVQLFNETDPRDYLHKADPNPPLLFEEAQKLREVYLEWPKYLDASFMCHEYFERDQALGEYWSIADLMEIEFCIRQGGKVYAHNPAQAGGRGVMVMFDGFPIDLQSAMQLLPTDSNPFALPIGEMQAEVSKLKAEFMTTFCTVMKVDGKYQCVADYGTPTFPQWLMKGTTEHDPP